MSYLTPEALEMCGFCKLGSNVKVSERASIYNCDLIELGDNVRIDDFCVLSGRIVVGRNVHIAPHCLVAGGDKGVFIGDFAGLAYFVQVFSQSDDYSGATMTNPTVPAEYKNEFKREVVIGRHCIVGAGSIVMPGVHLAEGTAVGAMTLIRKSTEEWSIYLGNPGKRIAPRKRDLLRLESEYLARETRDSL